MSAADRDYPRLFPGPEQTIAGIGRAIREGRVTCADVLNRCLEQVDLWEPKVHAWVVLDRDGAIQQARALDAELKAGQDRGPLHGIPIGIKDLIDVNGLPTACGAGRWVNRVAGTDAKVVERLRTAGAVIMGKTVTTAYACLDPAVTRNPWNLDRTPGGSSSGSAAAVACGMCFGAIGTQTGGSITRPASFCGVAGMVPSPGFVSTAGVLPFAPSLDRVGPIARTVGDLRLMFGGAREARASLPEIEDTKTRRTSPPKLCRLRGFFERTAEPSVRSSVDEFLKAFESHAGQIVEIDDPVDFDRLLKNHGQIVSAESASVHTDWLKEFPDDYPLQIRITILRGQCLPAHEYVWAKDQQAATRFAVVQSLLDAGKPDALVTPAAIGTAPDSSSTGDPAFNAPWSFSQLPTVSFPIGVADDSMPIALQLVGYPLHDFDLLNTAEWCEQVIRTWRQ